jgi:CRP/FNR family cyclic AMP-dependent transcriptional regulator
LGKGDLGKLYKDGEVLCREGDKGDHLYIIQRGTVEVVTSNGDHETSLATLCEGAIIGEMAIFEKEPRSATVRAVGEVLALTVDRKNLLRRVSEDPTLAFRLIRTLSERVRRLTITVRDLTEELERLR